MSLRRVSMACAAVLLIGGSLGLSALAKGKPPGGGGNGETTPPGTVYFLDVADAEYWRMDADGSDKTFVLAQLTTPNNWGAHVAHGSQPSFDLHGGNRWFLDRRESGSGNLELIARRASGVSVVLWTDSSESISVRQFRWAKDDSFVVFVIHDTGLSVAKLLAADVDWSSGVPELGTTSLLFGTTLGDIRGFDISPDGTKVAYHQNSSRTIIVRDLASGATVSLGPGVQHSLEWSPVGSLLAFEREIAEHGGDSSIYVCTIRPDGSDLSVLVVGQHPNWSPDGEHLAYTRLVKDGKGKKASSAYEVFRTPAAGGTDVNMTGDMVGNAWTSAWR